MVQVATLKEEAGHARTLPVTGPEGCLVTSSEGSVEVALRSILCGFGVEAQEEETTLPMDVAATNELLAHSL